jgi:uncharacterized protein (TIGR00297 family)
MLSVVSVTVGRLLAAVLLTLALAVSARLARAVTTSGMAAGALLALVLYIGGGAGLFATLVMVFILAVVTTRLGYWRKERMGIAERRSGRSASQIIANLAAAAGMALLAVVADHPEGWLIAATAALAAPAADTVSSEVGQAVSRRAYLITDFQRVPVGTDGGISLWGTMSGIMAAVLVALVGAVGHVIEWRWVLPVASAGIIGMIVDSFLGAWLERRELLNNDGVNFFSTVAAAVFAVFLYWSRHGQYWLT